MFAKSTKYESLYTVYWYAKLLVCDCDIYICHFCKGLEQVIHYIQNHQLYWTDCQGFPWQCCNAHYAAQALAGQPKSICRYIYLKLIEAPHHHMAHRRHRPSPVGMWEKIKTKFIKLTIHDFESGSWSLCSSAFSVSWPSSFVSTGSLLAFLAFLAVVLPSALRFAAARPQSHAEFGMGLKWGRQLLQCDNYI